MLSSSNLDDTFITAPVFCQVYLQKQTCFFLDSQINRFKTQWGYERGPDADPSFYRNGLLPAEIPAKTAAVAIQDIEQQLFACGIPIYLDGSGWTHTGAPTAGFTFCVDR